jgi:hypothetical protein
MRRAARGTRRLEHGNAGFERFVLLAGETGHIFGGLEFLAFDQVEIAQKALGLGPEQRLELAPHALRDTGRIIH